MTRKLTLSIDEEVIKKAKQYAGDHNRSLSDMVETYLKSLGKTPKVKKTNKEYVADKLRGSIKVNVPADFDWKESRDEYLKEKYLK